MFWAECSARSVSILRQFIFLENVYAILHKKTEMRTIMNYIVKDWG